MNWTVSVVLFMHKSAHCWCKENCIIVLWKLQLLKHKRRKPWKIIWFVGLALTSVSLWVKNKGTKSSNVNLSIFSFQKCSTHTVGHAKPWTFPLLYKHHTKTWDISLYRHSWIWAWLLVPRPLLQSIIILWKWIWMNETKAWDENQLPQRRQRIVTQRVGKVVRNETFLRPPTGNSEESQPVYSQRGAVSIFRVRKIKERSSTTLKIKI